tara:strand:- start:144 stop:1127 length:984 start_codon:yes stop_codon:yes gene_type:complete
MITVSFPLSSTVVGQLGSPNPDINLDCPDSTVEIEVGPGDSRVGSVICTLENPSIHQEEVNITVDEVGLNIAYPGTVSVSAGGEETFTITWSADPGSDVETLTSEVEVVVESFALGIPCPQCTSKSDSVKIDILPFGRPAIDMVPQEISLENSGSATLNFTVRNSGNYEDTLSIGMENQTGLEQFGFTFQYSDNSVKLPVNGTKDVVLTITASEEIADGTFTVLLQVSSQLADDSGDSWIIEENFRLQSIAKQESFLTTSVDNVPAWAVTTALVLAGLAVVGAIVFAVKLGMSRRGGGDVEFDFEDDFDDDFDLEDDDFEDLGLDDL